MKTLLVASTVTKEFDWEPQIIVAPYNSLSNEVKNAIYSYMDEEEGAAFSNIVLTASVTVALAYRDENLVGWAASSGKKPMTAKNLPEEFGLKEMLARRI